MHRRSFIAAAATTLGVALLPRISTAVQLGEVRFDDDLNTPIARLKLVGTGLFYYRSFIKIAAAGLYLDEQADSLEVLGDVAKRLEMSRVIGSAHLTWPLKY